MVRAVAYRSFVRAGAIQKPQPAAVTPAIEPVSFTVSRSRATATAGIAMTPTPAQARRTKIAAASPTSRAAVARSGVASVSPLRERAAARWAATGRCTSRDHISGSHATPMIALAKMIEAKMMASVSDSIAST
jgi:hypothetical protein